MKAAIIAVGSELLGTDRLDTNSLKLTAVLESHGVELIGKSVFGDDEPLLAGELARRLAQVDLVLVTGGLGPTADDITRAATARALGRTVRMDPALEAAIRARFEGMGITMPEVNRRQAEVIDGATVLDNPRGTAPGLRLEEDGATVFLFPGVPRELEGMIEADLRPWLAARSGGAAREQRALKVACVPESTLEEWVAPAYGEFGRETITVLAKPGEIELRFWATGNAAARAARLDEVEARLRELVGPAIYAVGSEATLETTVGELLRAAGRTVATAESCTGGLVAERLTRVAGSSDYFLGGAVTYSNQLKSALLGVDPELIESRGAVSEGVARAMAAGGRRALGADYCIALTGIAGPGGGSSDKPVGTVHIVVAGPTEGEAVHRRICYPGGRDGIRQLSSQVGLEMLRRQLLAAAVGE
jgi:nicotinamide-nucleotide amidase